jgi:hypothetical protein
MAEGWLVAGDEMRGKCFVDHSMRLDGGTWEDCIFDGCVLTLDNVEGLTLSGRFRNCHLIGDGWMQLFSRSWAWLVPVPQAALPPSEGSPP